MQPNFLPRHSPTVSCLLSLHIDKVSRIFPAALTQVVEPKKNMDRMWAQQGATLTCEDSEWSRKFEEPWQFEERDWRGWGMFFCKAASKGLPRPFNAAGWRCSKYMPFRKHLTPTMTNLFERHVSYSLEDNYPFVGSCPSTNFRSFPPSFLLLFFSTSTRMPLPQKQVLFLNIASHKGPILVQIIPGR